MAGYTKKYREQKTKAGRYKGKVDLIGGAADVEVGSDLHASIRYRIINRLKRIIEPMDIGNQKKMEGLTAQRNFLRRDIMTVSENGYRRFLKFVYKSLTEAKDPGAKGMK